MSDVNQGTAHVAASPNGHPGSEAVERYIVRVRSDWAYIYIDEANGVFASYSSYGNYAYCWRHIGDDTLKEFLIRLDFDYFMGKTRPDYCRFDSEATSEGIQRTIIEARREGSLTAEEARSAWSDLADICRDSSEGFFADFCQCRALMNIYGGDYCDIARDRPDGDSRGFWREIWPEFIKQITPKSPLDNNLTGDAADSAGHCPQT
jgi:hypothetical protein